MVAAGIPPFAAMMMSIVVYAGASMLAAAQFLSDGAPIAALVLTVFFINLRFLMYSASLRPHLLHATRGARLLAGSLLADNVYGVCLARFTEHPEMPGKLGFYLGGGIAIWITWQLAVGLGIAVGAGLPSQWRLEFAAPLAFIALTVPFLRDRAMVGAAIAAGIVAVAGAGLPNRLGLAAAAFVGIAVGLALQKKS